MKKINLLLTALFVLTAGSVYGQDDVTIAATADIASAIAITAGSNITIDFGDIDPDVAGGEAYIAAANDDEASSGIIAGGTIASFTATGTSEVVLTVTNGTLGHSVEVDQLTFLPTVTIAAGIVYKDGAAGAQSPVTLTATGVDFSVGGRLTGITGAAAGSYSTADGTPATINLDYTSI